MDVSDGRAAGRPAIRSNVPWLLQADIPDANTSHAKKYLIDSGARFAVTPLHLEVRNAFRLGVFRKLLTTVEGAAPWRNVEKDLWSGRLVRQSVKWPSVLRSGRAVKRATFFCSRHAESGHRPRCDGQTFSHRRICLFRFPPERSCVSHWSPG